MDLAFYPIKDQEIYSLYRAHLAHFWTPYVIPFVRDRDEFNRLPVDTQRYVKFLLSLFAQLDGLVAENLVERFTHEIKELCKEAVHFFAIQNLIEVIHNETYSIMLKIFITDPEELEKSLNSIETYPSIKGIGDWAKFWMNPSLPLGERIVAFSAIEGVIFSSAFAGIYWLKKDNKLLGLTKANEWIARDEALHTMFGYTLYNSLVRQGKLEKVSTQRIKEIISSAVNVNEVFTREAMNCDLVSINADDMMSYVKSTADYLCKRYCGEKIYRCENLLSELTLAIGLANRSNFFETLSTEYSSSFEGEKGVLTYPFIAEIGLMRNRRGVRPLE
jgi:ribonucleoside-diphosphate reductase subunit M2